MLKTLKYIDRLKTAGLSHEQAETYVKVMEEILQDNKSLSSELRGDLIATFTPMFEKQNLQIQKMFNLVSSFVPLFEKIDARFDKVDQRFASVDIRLTAVNIDILEMKSEILTAIELSQGILKLEETVEIHSERLSEVETGLKVVRNIISPLSK
jgi:hypothetical protein